VAFDRTSIAEKLSALAADGVFIRTSSWKYPGWRTYADYFTNRNPFLPEMLSQ